jgi:hypothetical protein
MLYKSTPQSSLPLLSATGHILLRKFAGRLPRNYERCSASFGRLGEDKLHPYDATVNDAYQVYLCPAYPKAGGSIRQAPAVEHDANNERISKAFATAGDDVFLEDIICVFI